ncbi:helicase-related protein [Wohlfahrtiimonas populi]|uniref:helicase-related protein n=1 Tax=Wohlfahrtiimonas populi TaxID=1940240 RepID=UPI00098D2690|nr:helicase-related protein [Wohlfahrtiimonas populi]
MNKKITVDSCDTLSDHAKQVAIVYPELKKLHSTSIVNKETLQFLQSECQKFDGKRPIVVITATVSACFDVALLLKRVLGEDKVQTIYPHTAHGSSLRKAVIVAPMMTLQMTNALSESAAEFSNFIVISQEKGLTFIANIVKPVLSQLAEDCKVLSLMSVNEDPSSQPVKKAEQIVKVEKTEKTVESKVKIIIEVEAEPEVTVAEEPSFGFIVEAEEAPNAMDFQVEAPSMDSAVDTVAEESMDEHHIVLVDRNYKRSYLRNRLKGSEKKTLIITRTRHNAHRLEEYLYQGKVRSRILHANLSDEAKDKVIERFVSGDLSVLLLPEAVAQTIELTGITDIIFFDLPDVGLEFKERINTIGERFNVHNTSSIVTLDEIPWVESMEQELKWTLPKVQPAPPQRSHNILRIKNRNTKDKPEKTEKRVGVSRGLRKLGGKNNNNNNQHSQQPQKKRSNHFAVKQMKDDFNDHNSISHQSDDPFNSINQSIVNENRNPFAFDSFEASVSRQNKQRVKQLFNRKEKPMKEVQSDFNPQRTEKKNVKIMHKKKRTFDIDGNQ